MTNRVKKIMKLFCYDKKDFDKVFSLNYSELNAIWQKARKDLGYADKSSIPCTYVDIPVHQG